jgi:3-oxoacyl-[acyl-carrier protein] reductase
MIEIDLTGRRCLVTGAASGIGAATAEFLARAGADLILVDVDKGPLVETADLSRQLGAEVATATLDVRESAPVNELVEQQSSNGKRIDVLVSNAGIAHSLRLEEITDEEWEKVMNINLKGTFNFSRALFPVMKRQGFGRIITVSSINAKTGGGILSTSAYSAAKAGILGLTKGLAREGAPHNVHANVVVPGLIDTPMPRSKLSAKQFSDAERSIPIGRAGKPEEVANVILFLASPLAEYILGAVVHVNGGLLMAD